MSRAGREGSSAPPGEGGVQVVLFRVGAHRFAVPREQVKAIRESPRVRSRLETGSVAASSIPLLSLSTVLGLDRDTSVDRRVLEVEHWGGRLGLEVTVIEGIRDLGRGRLHPLPSLLQRNLGSANVLGILEWPLSDARAGRLASEEGAEAPVEGSEIPAVALDLSALLVEQGVEIPESDSP
jgi:chemotaxis signal transduction protein